MHVAVLINIHFVNLKQVEVVGLMSQIEFLDLRYCRMDYLNCVPILDFYI